MKEGGEFVENRGKGKGKKGGLILICLFCIGVIELNASEWVGGACKYKRKQQSKEEKEKKQKGYLELRVFRLGRYQRWGLNLNWVERGDWVFRLQPTIDSIFTFTLVWKFFEPCCDRWLVSTTNWVWKIVRMEEYSWFCRSVNKTASTISKVKISVLVFFLFQSADIC